MPLKNKATASKTQSPEALTPEMMTKSGILKRFHAVELSDYYGSMPDIEPLKKLFYTMTDKELVKELTHAQAIYKTVKFYADNLEKAISLGKGLFMFGESGTGKSLLLMALARTAMKKGIRTKVVTAQGLINAFARSWTDEDFNFNHALMGVPLLCIEEMNKENFTTLTTPTLTRVIKYREEAQLSTILTSNQGIEVISSNYSVAIASAITGCCKIIEFESKLDWRSVMQEQWETDIKKG